MENQRKLRRAMMGLLSLVSIKEKQRSEISKCLDELKDTTN